MRALARRGFDCDPAEDGIQAEELLSDTAYDVVVTDLRMPRRHGHSLAVDLLARDNRPAVVVLTGVAEPKLANDLIVRGVDDVMFKPVDYDFLALKLKALAERRREVLKSRGTEPGRTEPTGNSTVKEPGENINSLGSAGEHVDIDAKLAHLSKILPVSQAAFDVFGMASSDSYDSQQIAAAIARDPSLSVDVLRLANSSFYNASGNKIVELEDAVVRIGQKRIGELALATSAMAALTANVLPWMDVALAWQRSVAAGVATDLLLAQRKSEPDGVGIFLSSIMHPLGRIALGMLFPQQYREMVETCSNQNTTLLEQEQKLFPISHGRVMSRLLETWNIPAAAHESLRYVAEDYATISRLREPLRTKAELVKLAILIGRIAVGQWEPWDQIELPPSSVLERLELGSLADVISTTRRDAEQIINFRVENSGARSEPSSSRRGNADSGQLSYCNLSMESFDFLAEVISSVGIRLRRLDGARVGAENAALINCLGTPPYRLTPHVDPQRNDSDRLIVSDGDHSGPLARYGKVFTLPGSFRTLRAACQKLVRYPEPLANGQHFALSTVDSARLNLSG